YNMTKDKKAHPERMETKKYCRFCKSHTLHKETK
ncbi:MAG TPA: 50S ribosomal protein L33, partial [Candidatus Mediterraneibacter colneyensis]|nr:50S ribosomal protein L33 [Candidatus Mediterraneibacter colneyensis]